MREGQDNFEVAARFGEVLRRRCSHEKERSAAGPVLVVDGDGLGEVVVASRFVAVLEEVVGPHRQHPRLDLARGKKVHEEVDDVSQLVRLATADGHGDHEQHPLELEVPQLPLRGRRQRRHLSFLEDHGLLVRGERVDDELHSPFHPGVVAGPLLQQENAEPTQDRRLLQHGQRRIRRLRQLHPQVRRLAHLPRQRPQTSSRIIQRTAPDGHPHEVRRHQVCR
mmetsp:Transcript_36915/g.118329  ORF Transcript_36915/g.118329 Transcript_36915/m.118329 type:complete len:223 (-) Transcript_36915:76-744(-)